MTIDFNLHFVINAPNAKKKRKNRMAAMKNKKPFTLDNDKMAARLELAQRAIDARPTSAALIADNTPIHCNRTGALLGTIDANAIALCGELDLPESTRLIWQNHHSIHQAWLDTSPAQLIKLQRLMPHEYCSYLYTYLLELNSNDWRKIYQIDIEMPVEVKKPYGRQVTIQTKQDIVINSMPATIKNRLLQELYGKPLAQVIECAELLRIFAGLCGKNPAIVAAMPTLFQKSTNNADTASILPHSPANFLWKFNTDLINYIREVVMQAQKKIHAQDCERAHVVTATDIYKTSTAQGIKLFRHARISLDDDNPLIVDVAEMFENAGIEGTHVVRNASELEYLLPKRIPNEPLFEGRVSVSKPEKRDGKVILKPITL